MKPLSKEFSDYCKVRGNRAKLASELGINISAPYQWVNVPLDRVVDVSRITGIPRPLLRPDIFGEVSA